MVGHDEDVGTQETLEIHDGDSDETDTDDSNADGDSEDSYSSSEEILKNFYGNFRTSNSIALTIRFLDSCYFHFV